MERGAEQALAEISMRRLAMAHHLCAMPTTPAHGEGLVAEVSRSMRLLTYRRRLSRAWEEQAGQLPDRRQVRMAAYLLPTEEN